MTLTALSSFLLMQKISTTEVMTSLSLDTVLDNKLTRCKIVLLKIIDYQL